MSDIDGFVGCIRPCMNLSSGGIVEVLGSAREPRVAVREGSPRRPVASQLNSGARAANRSEWVSVPQGAIFFPRFRLDTSSFYKITSLPEGMKAVRPEMEGKAGSIGRGG